MERLKAIARDPRAIVGALAILLFASFGFGVALYSRFPAPTDELEHLSFIRSLAAQPTLFPKYGSYFVLSNDLAQTTERINYLAHPPLYYLLMAPLPADVLSLRFVNLLMALVGAACTIMALVTLAPTHLAGVLAILFYIAFARSAAVAGTINNDNLVLFETGLLYLTLASPKDRSFAQAAILALAGWTKLNAFVAVTLIIGLAHLSEILTKRAQILSVKTAILSCGAAFGLAPTVANLLTFAAPIYVPYDFLFVPEASRRHYDFWGFLSFFLHRLGEKFPPVEGSFDASYPLALGFGIALCALPLARDHARRLAQAFLGALALFLAIHLLYAWRSFTTLGSISDAQIRYYNVLWPGYAFALALAIDRIFDLVRQRVKNMRSRREGAAEPRERAA